MKAKIYAIGDKPSWKYPVMMIQCLPNRDQLKRSEGPYPAVVRISRKEFNTLRKAGVTTEG